MKIKAAIYIGFLLACQSYADNHSKGHMDKNADNSNNQGEKLFSPTSKLGEESTTDDEGLLHSIFSSKIHAKCAKRAKKKPRRYIMELDDPTYPAICPLDESACPKIPRGVLKALDNSFRANGGAVLTRNHGYHDMDWLLRTERSTDDYVQQLQQKLASDEWEAFDTPSYELGDEDFGKDIGFGFGACTLDEDPEGCSPPEPYPLRTNLPKMAQPRCFQDPYAIVLPATYEDAAKAIDAIREHDEKFTILSGGHDYECQSAAPDHVLILTSLLNKIEFDWDHDPPQVTVGAGVLWQTVYDKLFEAERDFNSPWGVMGAQCGFVSVSGYTLGGGYSWHMTGFHGIGAETAKNIKVALADGSVVDAGIDNEHSQLRWALAGSGGMNLAMALEFTFDLKQSLPRGYNFTRVEYRWNEDEEPADYEEEVYEVTKAWMLAVDGIKDDEDVGVCQVRLRRESYGFRLQVNSVCNDCNLIERTGTGFGKLMEKHREPYRIRFDNYVSINDYVKTRTNRYPRTSSSPRTSSFVKGNNGALIDALDVMMRFYIPSFNGDPTPASYDPIVAGNDLNLYMVNGAIKDPSLTSLRPEIADASWHFTVRSSHSPDETTLEKIRCKNRAINEELKSVLATNWLGPYWNYFDSTADKSDYYGDYFEILSEVKEEYDPHNVFRKIKGIKINENDIACLEEGCEKYSFYWE